MRETQLQITGGGGVSTTSIATPHARILPACHQHFNRWSLETESTRRNPPSLAPVCAKEQITSNRQMFPRPRVRWGRQRGTRCPRHAVSEGHRAQNRGCKAQGLVFRESEPGRAGDSHSISKSIQPLRTRGGGLRRLACMKPSVRMRRSTCPRCFGSFDDFFRSGCCMSDPLDPLICFALWTDVCGLPLCVSGHTRPIESITLPTLPKPVFIIN